MCGKGTLCTQHLHRTRTPELVGTKLLGSSKHRILAMTAYLLSM